MMIAEAAKKMPENVSKIIVLDPTENCPAAQVGAEQIVADFKDKDAIIELSEKSDIITYEIESGDSEVLKSVEKMQRLTLLLKHYIRFKTNSYKKHFLKNTVSLFQSL